MGNLIITNIDRNIGALTQEYRIEYKAHASPTWVHGPTLSYEEAQSQPAGVLPLTIVLGAPGTYPAGIDVRIVTLCRIDKGFISVLSDPQTISVNNTPCG